MTEKEDKVRVHLVIKGRVQGIFFRATACDEATRLGVTGWVINCRDGSVECVVEGEKDKVDRLISWCHHGPPGARVTDVDVRWEECTGEFDSFSVGY